jgi:hypothetical protein
MVAATAQGANRRSAENVLRNETPRDSGGGKLPIVDRTIPSYRFT